MFSWIVKTTDDTFVILASNEHDACMDVLCEYEHPESVRIVSCCKLMRGAIPIFVGD